MQNLSEILKLAEDQATPIGLTIVDIRLTQQGKRRILEVTICRKGGRISLDDCEELSRRLDKAMDEADPPVLEGSFILDVQSPGLERQLKTEREFAIFAGDEVEVKIKDPKPGLGDFISGKLHSLSNGTLKIGNPRPIISKENLPKKSKAKAALAQQEYPSSVELDFNRVSSVKLKAPEIMEDLDDSDSGSDPEFELN